MSSKNKPQGSQEDVSKSQRGAGDLEALAPEARPVRCGGTYCQKNYSNRLLEEEA